MEKSKTRQILLLTITICVFNQCDKNADIIKSFTRFPTTYGNQWIYEYTYRFTPYDSNGNAIQKDTMNYTVDIMVQINDDSFFIDDSLNTFSFQSFLVDKPEVKSYQFYTNNTDGFLNHAHANSGYIVLHKKKETIVNPIRYLNLVCEFIDPISLALIYRLPLTPDSIFVDNPPRVSLKYPLKLDSDWIYFENSYFKIQKKITDITDVKTPAGKFECYEIKYNYLKSPVDSGSFEISEYFASVGLVKTVITTGIIHLTTATGEIISSGKGISEYKLKEYSIVE